MPCPQPPLTLRKTLSSSNLSTSSNGLDRLIPAISAASRRRRRPPPPLPARRAKILSLSRSGHAHGLFDLFGSPDLTPTAFFFNTLINAFIVARRRSEAREAFAHLKRSGVTLTNPSYSILLKLQFLLETSSESPYSIIGAMFKSGCSPDAVTYSTLVSGLCGVGRVDEAWWVLDRMGKESCPPTVRCYTSMILGYCKLGRVGEARDLIGRAEDKDAVMYTVLIGALCRRGEIGEVEKILGESEFNGWEPNGVTYNVYINGLCKLGEVDRAFRQLDVMREKGFLPTLETLHVLFASLCRDQSDERLWEAKALLDRSDELDWDVNAYFYCTLMSKFCDKGMNKPVVSLLTCMFKRGIEPDTCTYTVVLRSLCKKKYLRKAKCIFDSMGSEADVVAYNTLLLGFNRANEHDAVRILFMNMVEDKVSPNGFTFCVMIDSLCRENKYPEAVDCFIHSIRNGFDRNLISRPIWWLVKEGKVKELLNLFEEMFGRGFVLNDFVFDPLIRAFCRKGLCQSVQSDIFSLIFDKMLGIR